MAAATAAVLDEAYARRVLELTRAARERFSEVAARLPGISVCPSHTNFVLLRFDGARRDARGAADALLAQGIRTQLTGSLGPANSLRITLGREMENERVLAVLSEYLAD